MCSPLLGVGLVKNPVVIKPGPLRNIPEGALQNRGMVSFKNCYTAPERAGKRESH